MNEQDARALFAPARARGLPAPSISMTQVYEAQARQRRRRRRSAIVACLTLVLATGVGAALLSASPTRPEPVGSPVKAAALPPTLDGALDELVLPPGSTQVSPMPTATPLVMEAGGNGPSTVHRSRYWTSPLSRAATIAWLQGHTPVEWSFGTTATIGGDTTAGSWELPVNPGEDGPHLSVSVQDLPSGSAVLVDAYETPRPAKAATETVVDVDSVTVTRGGGHPAVTVGGDDAHRLAADLDALVTNSGSEGISDGISCADSTPTTLSFASAADVRTFVVDCDEVSPAGPGQAPGLDASDALLTDVASVLAGKSTAPYAVLAQLTPPPGAPRLAAAPDQELADPSAYASVPGYQQQQWFWRSTQSPADALAAMTAHPPAGLIADGSGTGTDSGRAMVSASYTGADTAASYGPNLTLIAEALPDGSTGVTAQAWEIVKPAKPATFTVVGPVSAVTATRAGDPQQVTVTGDQATQLTTDFDALGVNAIPPHECGASPLELTITFVTAAGSQTYVSGCGTVQLSPQTGSLMLATSTTFGDDVDRDFATLIPVPAPTKP